MSTHRITIKEAMSLTGKSRRTLYRDMAAGRLSYHVGDNGRREVVVSELMRAYGALVGSPEPAPASEAPGASASLAGAGDSRTADLLAELLEVTRQQSHTLEQQREELAALRREVAELRTLPAPGALAPHDQLAPDQTPPPKRHTTERPAMARVSESALSFGDLLERMEKRQQH
ncbi:hypothetical protein C9993_05540 [Marinobacter sp. Z-F4-2]|jgi:hypothetical protein|nr:hypothetical protein C9993_05540 [Marinobacter sp. Z-F4-2]